MSELQRKQTIAECVETYQRAAKKLGAALDQIAEVERDLEGQLGIQYELPTWLSRVKERDMRHIRAKTWHRIVERLELTRVLSVAARTELERQIDKDELGDVTMETATGLLRYFSTNLEDLFSDAVREVFEFLRPRRSRYKTNTEFEIGKRVVLQSQVARYYSSTYTICGYDHEREQRLIALDRVFHGLEGKGMVSKTYRGELVDAILATPIDGDGRGETTYFRFRCCKNGNLHIEFKHMDLVAQLNRIAGGKRLKPAA